MVVWPITQPRQLGTANILIRAPSILLITLCFDWLPRWLLYISLYIGDHFSFSRSIVFYS